MQEQVQEQEQEQEQEQQRLVSTTRPVKFFLSFNYLHLHLLLPSALLFPLGPKLLESQSARPPSMQLM